MGGDIETHLLRPIPKQTTRQELKLCHILGGLQVKKDPNCDVKLCRYPTESYAFYMDLLQGTPNTLEALLYIPQNHKAMKLQKILPGLCLAVQGTFFMGLQIY